MRVNLFYKFGFFAYWRRLVLALPFALFMVACGKNSSQEGLGQLAFKALKQNDYASYARYLISKSDADWVLSQFKNSPNYATLTPEKQRHVTAVIGGIGGRIDRLHQQLQSNFSATFDRGVRQGIIWSKTNFVKIEIDDEQKLFDLKGIVQQTIYIVFSQNEKTYKIRLRNNIKMSRGWIIVDGFAWETTP